MIFIPNACTHHLPRVCTHKRGCLMSDEAGSSCIPSAGAHRVCGAEQLSQSKVTRLKIKSVDGLCTTCTWACAMQQKSSQSKHADV